MMIKTNKTELLFFSLVTFGWLALIYSVSSLPPPKILGEMPGLDKVAHFGVYSILGLMILAILIRINHDKRIPVLWLTVLIVVIAGLFDEFHQGFVPLRNSDGWDLVADFCGGLFATVVISRFVKKREINHA